MDCVDNGRRRCVIGSRFVSCIDRSNFRDFGHI